MKTSTFSAGRRPRSRGEGARNLDRLISPHPGLETVGNGFPTPAEGINTPLRRGVHESGDGSGFTLVEILVAAALMSFIILGLVAMFSQTQRAFTQSLTDLDTLENGRAVMELLVRDLAEAAPANISRTVNFYVEVPQRAEPIYTPPLLQGLPPVSAVVPVGGVQLRTNYLEPFYFLSRPNQMWPDRAWAEIGYYVVPDVQTTNGALGIGIGTLYRYATTNVSSTPPLPFVFPENSTNPPSWGNGFLSALATLRTDTSIVPANTPISAVTRVAEGVIHLRVRPFATNGFPIMSDLLPPWVGYAGFSAGVWTNNNYRQYAQPILTAITHVNTACPEWYDGCWFMSNAVPAAVEIELGILESQTYQSYKALVLANPAAGRAFLSNHVAQVHIFRQRIPIHNVDPSAY